MQKMTTNQVKSFLGFLLLGGAVFGLRHRGGGVLGFGVATSAVMLFWYFHTMKLTLTSIRTLVSLVVIFGFAFLTLQGRWALLSTEATTGWVNAGELNPAAIAHLKLSHERAFELYFDHWPQGVERYLRLGVLTESSDGLHYTRVKASLDVGRVPEAQAWVQVHLDLPSVQQKVNQIQKWWATDFHYSLDPGTMMDSHPLDEFLFRRKLGFCEHYAGALATLLKLSGAEARVAVGFAGGAWNPILHTLTYEVADAHAWVEVWDPVARHWETLDPTLWVSPEENHFRSDRSTGFALLWAFSALAGLIGLTTFQRREPLEKLLGKLEALEKKHGLSSLGLTISERLERLGRIRSHNEEALRTTLSLYLRYFYRNDSTPQVKRFLLRSLARW